MNKYLLILLAIIGTTNLFGQDHNSDTLFVINLQTFRFQTNNVNDDQVTLTIFRNSEIIKTDTLYAGGLTNLQFPDFDNDGNKDIMLTYMGNNFTYLLYLFDNTNNEFKFIEGFDRFPDAMQLKTNPKYYYSYHRAGCADLNWVSDLFYIDNFKSKHIGHIYGQGCDFEVIENPQVIKIFKITDNKGENKKQIEELPYLKNIPDFGDKWDYIEKYWNENYEKFN
ncbi:MAG: hypothetical protein KKD74_06170 [Bacteroidetes bacterium]|nr:hypothetical protein [Bacteroidota bacterium]